MEIIYQSHPDVTVATNKFVGIPTIIQFENTPLLEVGKYEVGFTHCEIIAEKLGMSRIL